MENASKALIMAASMLLSVMIITVGIVLFRSFGSTGSDIIDKMSQTQITEFNNQFYKYKDQENEEYVNKIKIRGLFNRIHRSYEDFFYLNPDMLNKKEELLKIADDIINKNKKEND